MLRACLALPAGAVAAATRLALPAGVLGTVAVMVAAPVAAAQRTGGVEYRPLPWLAATAFEVAPPTLAPGATLTAARDARACASTSCRRPAGAPPRACASAAARPAAT